MSECHRPGTHGGRAVAAALAVLALVGCDAGSGDEPRDGAVTSRPEQAAVVERVQGAVDDFLAAHLVPGASVSVIDRGKLVEVVSGVADVDAAQAVTTRTQFRVASVTKMYVAAVVLRLVDRGELSLDEPIGRYALPAPLSFAGDLTLRQLLSHTSGLGQTYVRDEDRGRPLSQVEQVERMPPPVCAPSACWSYGDVNYVLAEVVLESRAGRSLADLIREELVEPLDLHGTAVLDARVVATPPQYALVHDDADRPVEPHRVFEQTFPLTPTLVTTATDAARFAAALFGGDVLSAAGLAEMLDTGAMRGLPCPAIACRFEYGLGVFHYDELAGLDLLGHDGSSGTIVVHDPGRDLSVAILTNGGEQDIGAFLEAMIRAVDDGAG